MDEQTALRMMDNMETMSAINKAIRDTYEMRIRRLRQALRDAGLSLHHIQAIESGQEIPDEPLEMTYE